MNSEKDLLIENFENNENKDILSKEKKKLPLICKIIYAISAVCVLLYILFIIFPSFADAFNKYISPAPRFFLSMISAIIPFSIAEYLLLCIPIILAIAVTFGIKHYASSWRNVGVFCLIVLSVGAYIFSAFTISFVPAYRGSRLDVKMGLDKKDVSAEELLYTAEILAEKINEECKNIPFSESGASLMPYGYGELNDKLMSAYDKVCDEYDFIQHFRSSTKRIMLSEPMTYTHISGVYTFFTGEANINTNFPDYTIPYTAAHELAHQRGIAREDEANFVAFLVCSNSDDSYIRYCAYLNLFTYVSNALYSANPQYYLDVYKKLPQKAILEQVAYTNFFDKYQNSVASNVSETINDTFLTINGTEGTKSYGMVVDLAVAYYKQDK